MKKLIVLAMGTLLLGSLISCNPVPTKQLEDAKTAIERAESVEAPFYAAGEYKSAKDDYASANQLVEDKKNKDAKAKAISSKEQADTAYDLASAKRAADIYNKDKDLLVDAEQNFATILKPTEFSKAKTDFDALTTTYASSNYTLTYSNGMTLYNELTDLVKYLKGETDKARNAIADAQDKYDQAENNDIVREFAMADLKLAIPLLEEAREAYEKGDLKTATAKADEAKTQIQAANDKAQAEYEKYLEQQREQQLKLQLEQQKQKELEKNKADEYLKKAQEMLKKLEKDDTTGMLKTKLNHFALHKTEFMVLGQTLDIIDEEESTVDPGTQDIAEEDITEEMVQKYYRLAQESYDKGEYLDSVDYSREAIRLGEILLGQQTMDTYIVEDHPGNEDCLWKIAGKKYDKQYWMWPIIWRANKFKIKDPDLIYPDQEFAIPPSLVK